jgi:hypothetical protein
MVLGFRRKQKIHNPLTKDDEHSIQVATERFQIYNNQVLVFERTEFDVASYFANKKPVELSKKQWDYLKTLKNGSFDELQQYNELVSKYGKS